MNRTSTSAAVKQISSVPTVRGRKQRSRMQPPMGINRLSRPRRTLASTSVDEERKRRGDQKRLGSTGGAPQQERPQGAEKRDGGECDRALYRLMPVPVPQPPVARADQRSGCIG